MRTGARRTGTRRTRATRAGAMHAITTLVASVEYGAPVASLGCGALAPVASLGCGALALVASLGCGAPARPTPPPAAPAPAPPPRDLAVADPAPKIPTPPPAPVADRRRLLVDNVPILLDRTRRVIDFSPRPLRPQAEPVAASDLWSPCVRDFVAAQPAHARRPLTAAFSRFVVTCAADNRVVLSTPLEYRDTSSLSYRATLGGDRPEVAVVSTTCAPVTSAAHVVIAYDGRRWVSPEPAAAVAGGCYVATIAYDRAVRSVLRDVVDAREAVMRLDGADRATEDTPITDEMKHDLWLMIDAVDALTSP